MDFPFDGGAPASDELPPMTIDAPLGLARPLTIKAREYWEMLRGNAEMPAREAITPRGMREFLANIALFDLTAGVEPMDFTIRVAGTKIEDIFGQVKGLSVRKSFPEAISTRWLKVLNCVMTRREPVRISSRVAYKNMNWLKSEMFAAPLGENGKIETVFTAVDIWPVEQPPGAKRPQA